MVDHGDVCLITYVLGEVGITQTDLMVAAKPFLLHCKLAIYDLGPKLLTQINFHSANRLSSSATYETLTFHRYS